MTTAPARVATVGDLVDALGVLDSTLPVRVALDGQERAAYVAAVVELPTDTQTGWTHAIWLRITGGVEPGQHAFAPRDVWADQDD